MGWAHPTELYRLGGGKAEDGGLGCGEVAGDDCGSIVVEGH